MCVVQLDCIIDKYIVMELCNHVYASQLPNSKEVD